jgi:hypothetical protein
MKKPFIQRTTHFWRTDHLAGSGWFALGMAILGSVFVQKIFTINTFLIILFGISLFLMAFFGLYQYFKIKKISQKKVLNLLNLQFPKLQYSAELLLQNPENLNFLETLQFQKNQEILEEIKEVIYPKYFYKSLVFCIICIFISYGIDQIQINKIPAFKTDEKSNSKQKNSLKTPQISLAEIKKVQIFIVPPSYTSLQKYESETMNIACIEKSNVVWNITTLNNPEKVFLVLNEKDSIFLKKTSENEFVLSKILDKSGFYTIGFQKDKQNKNSDLYGIEVQDDIAPKIVLSQPKTSVEIAFGDAPVVQFQATITDDFQVRNVDLVATIAKGSGEQVKFREVKIPLGNFAQKQVDVFKKLNLESLQMSWGDELYCYLQASDNKPFEPHLTRSETIFIVMEDTSQVSTMEDFGMPINQKPDFFRSQRQIIIDTQKLLAEQNKISKDEFQKRSSDLAFDQKALRYRYGQYLGEEYEQEAGGKIESEEENHKEETDQKDSKDLLKSYSHDHDNEKQGENHANTHEHEKNSNENNTANNQTQNLLEEYTHNHDSEDMNTFHLLSSRETLKKALAEMWQSELNLHLYNPKKALPYELKALKYLKQVQQKSRAYVKKVGFEPPPLKLEKRYSAELDKVKNIWGNKKNKVSENFIYIKKTSEFLEKYKSGDFKNSISDAEILTWKKAEKELADIATKQPRLYLPALQELKKMLQNPQNICKICLVTVEKAFYEILSQELPKPKTKQKFGNSLTDQYLKRL